MIISEEIYSWQKGLFILTMDEIDIMIEKIYPRVKNIPGVDKNLIKKCLIGIANLSDNEVDIKLKQLMKFL